MTDIISRITAAPQPKRLNEDEDAPRSRADEIADEILNEIVDEIGKTEEEMTERYDDMLDDAYSFKDVGGPFAHMLPSRVLKKVDPIWYSTEQDVYQDDHNEVAAPSGLWYCEREELDQLVDTKLDAAKDALEEEIGEEEAEKVIAVIRKDVRRRANLG